MAMDRRQLAPALLVSVMVHAGLLGLALFAWPHTSKPLPFGSAVPVTIVSDAPMTDVAPAVEGPELDPLTEEPIPDAPAEVPLPPAPDPIPAETKTPSKPADKAKPTPTPSPKSNKRSELDFDDLEKRLKKTGGGKPKPGGGDKGPARPASAPTPRPDGAGKGLNASSIAGLQAELQRRWNPNCLVEGGRSVKVTIQIVVAPSGFLIGEPKVVRKSGGSDDLTNAGATRAISAVKGALPFRDLPDGYIGEKLNINFDAQTACSL